MRCISTNNTTFLLKSNSSTILLKLTKSPTLYLLLRLNCLDCLDYCTSPCVKLAHSFGQNKKVVTETFFENSFSKVLFSAVTVSSTLNCCQCFKKRRGTVALVATGKSPDVFYLAIQCQLLMRNVVVLCVVFLSRLKAGILTIAC